MVSSYQVQTNPLTRSLTHSLPSSLTHSLTHSVMGRNVTNEDNTSLLHPHPPSDSLLRAVLENTPSDHSQHVAIGSDNFDGLITTEYVVLDFTNVLGVDATAARSCFLMLTQLMRVSGADSLTHLLTHPLTYSLTHSLTHSLNNYTAQELL